MQLNANSAILIAVLLANAAPAQITTNEDDKFRSRSIKHTYTQHNLTRKTTIVRPKTIRHLADHVSMLLQGESRARTLTQQVDYALQMVETTTRLQKDPRVFVSPILRESANRLRARLGRIAKRTLAAQRRRKRRPEKIEIEQTVLAQLNQAVNGGGRIAGNANNLAPQDYGPMLVELIQDTISPGSWDVNGGASTIRYWRPGMALVVRAPARVHSELGPVLGQLRQQ